MTAHSLVGNCYGFRGSYVAHREVGGSTLLQIVGNLHSCMVLQHREDLTSDLYIYNIIISFNNLGLVASLSLVAPLPQG